MYDGFFALVLIPAEIKPPGPETFRSPACRLSGLSRRSSCVPAELYPPLKQAELSRPGPDAQAPTATHPPRGWSYRHNLRTWLRFWSIRPSAKSTKNWNRAPVGNDR